MHTREQSKKSFFVNQPALNFINDIRHFMNTFRTDLDMATRPINFSSAGLFPTSRRVDPGLIRLAVAILTQAVRDLLAPQKKLESDWEAWKEDSKCWFNSQSLEPCSFHWVCQILGLSPEMVRYWVADLEKLDRREQQNALLSLLRLTQLRRRQEKEVRAN